MKFDNQLNRMKGLMNYGLQTENKTAYKAVEFSKLGADGKMYGIVREGAKFYIKVSDKTKDVLKEDYNYIGGFMNRKNYEYNSYANALKNFEMKMSSINESVEGKKIMVETWNPEKKEIVLAEASDKMKAEIARQRQIMSNANIIMEKKNYEVNLKECGSKECKNGTCCGGKGGDPFTKSVDSKFSAEDNNIGAPKKPVTGNKKNDDPNGKTKMQESEEVLGWNENPDYLDMSHGTEIGSDAPFDQPLNTNGHEAKNGVVEEGVEDSMIYNDNTNKPAPGTGEVNDKNTAPFNDADGKQIDEAFEDDAEDVEGDTEFDDTEDFDVEGGEGLDSDIEDDFGDEEDFDVEGDEDFDADVEGGEDFDLEMEDDTDDRLSSLEDLVRQIADKLGVDQFNDEPLYDDEDDDDFGGEDDFDVEDNDDFGGEDDFDVEDDNDFGGEDDFDDEMPMESVSRRRVMKEDRLDYFGKHPAYRKQPMRVPSNAHQEMPDYYDMNDDSVKNNEPYGKKIGSSAPFEISPEAINNAIAESVKRVLGKKKI